ncbi:Capsular polysaccharide phosphotransferase wcwK (Stealth protein wcwK) [hydrothermal vent metagenome]|uniref:Capsular polysaccharide phosphotransferase wcwK (Stealth protein wcwK) n=1 Tax=hydrothermal vent metagenome TaxID=652676 RepID=A0A1W1C4V6_9ZZZZ
MDKIDFVLPWVDSTDVAWQKEKIRYEAEIFNKCENDHGSLRYRDTNTLKYVLRSIEKNCPWYHQIIIITAGHKPQWINDSHPNIRFVTHKEIYFDSEDLPTFNSSSIEMNLPNIQALSEKFVYLNDDFLIWNPIEKSRFFVDDLPVDFLLHGWFSRNRVYQMLRDNSSWVKSLNNCVRLINSKFNVSQLNHKKEVLFHKSYGLTGKIRNFFLRDVWRKYFFFYHWHHPQPYRLSTLKEVYETFKEPMMECSKNRFRSDNDLTQYLYRYYHLAKGDFYPFYHNDGFYLNVHSLSELESNIEKLKTLSPNFVAVYDNYDDLEADEIVGRFTDYLEERFPEKASFEL